MPWIAFLALLMVAMLILSALGAEINFRRALDRRERIEARRRAAARPALLGRS
jgi:hypothetical protein